MNVAAYYRYSTDNKNQVDNSELRQKDAVERIIYGRKDWRQVDSFTDHAVSGTDDKPQLLVLKSKVESGELSIDVIAIDSLSRLSRRSITEIGSDIRWIKDAGIQLSIANKNSGDPFPVSDLDDDLSLVVDCVQNNQYVKKLSRDVTNGMRLKFDRGELGWCGRAPFGYDLVRQLDGPSTLKANQDLPVVREIFERILTGGSVRSCIDLLEKSGTLKKPNTSSIKNILRGSIYAGIRTFGVRAVGKHNSIGKHNLKWVAQNPLVQAESYQEYLAEGFDTCITIDEYEKVQGILDDNQKSFRRQPDRQKHLYSGLMRCGHCGASMVASTYKSRKSDEKLISYVCPKSEDGSSTCKEEIKPNRKQVRTDELEQMIGRQFAAIHRDPNFHRNNLEMLVDRIIKRSKSAVAVVEEDLAIQQKRLDELFDLFKQSGSETLKRQIDNECTKLDELRNRQDNALDVDDLLAFATEQSKGNKEDCWGRYLGVLYEMACHLASIKDLNERRAAIKIHAVEMASSLIETVADIAARIEVKFGPAAGEKIMDGLDQLTVAGDPEDHLKILRDLNLDHIQPKFELSKFRGKPRRMPTKLSFVFSVPSTNYTDKVVVVNSDRISLEERKR